jgi:hypothetical protein
MSYPGKETRKETTVPGFETVMTANGERQKGEVRRKRRLRNGAALLAITTAGALIGWPHLAGASGPGGKDVSPVVEANVAVKGPITMNVKSDAKVITTHITIKPLGHTAWHYHPGPHFVSVRKGTAVVYETDCTIRGTFHADQGFYDPGTTSPSHVQTARDVHTLRNPSSTEPLEVVITDIREGGRPATVTAQPQPAPCFL